jgi:hypothetical protein
LHFKTLAKLKKNLDENKMQLLELQKQIKQQQNEFDNQINHRKLQSNLE